MSNTMLALLAILVLPSLSLAQSDTSRRGDTTRTIPQDTSRRTQREARGEVNVPVAGDRFSPDRENHGLSADQAMELQRALSAVGCETGAIDGIVGPRTQRGWECFGRQRNLAPNDLETLFTALNLSFSRPPAPPPPAPREPDPPALPPVIRSFLRDTSVRRDTSLARDTTLRRDTTTRDTTRRDTTARKDSVRKPIR